MLRTKRVTDTLQTLFFLNNNIPRFLLNERACLKKKSSKFFFFSEENKHYSFFPDQSIWGRVFLAEWAMAPSPRPQRSSANQDHLAMHRRHPLHPGLHPTPLKTMPGTLANATGKVELRARAGRELSSWRELSDWPEGLSGLVTTPPHHG